MEQIGKYRIVRVVGEGGMGRVYEATDPVINRRVAVKTISQTVLQDADTRARFLREAQAAGQLSHPNLITIFDVGEEDGAPFIVMEYLEGEELTRVIAKRQLTLDAKLQLIIEVCQGLAYAHAKGLVHRDIKPANIFVTTGNQAKILDFGLARGTASELTQTGRVVGTPSYMAPEQVRGDKVDHRSDIFSVGVVLYELLSGHKAFKGDTVAATIFQVLERQPDSLQQLDPNMPPGIWKVVERAIAKDPGARYQQIDEMLADLAEVRIEAQPTTFLVRPPTPHPAAPRSAYSAPTPAGGAAATPPSRRHRRWRRSRRPETRGGCRGPLQERLRLRRSVAFSSSAGQPRPPLLRQRLARRFSPRCRRRRGSAGLAGPPASEPPAAAAAPEPARPAAPAPSAETPARQRDERRQPRGEAGGRRTAAAERESLPVAKAPEPGAPVQPHPVSPPPPPAQTPEPSPAPPREVPPPPPERPAPAPLPEARIPPAAPGPPPAAPAPVDPTPAVTETMVRYKNALESRDIGALKQVWPALGGRQEQAIRNEFDNSRSIAVDLQNLSPVVSNNTATVTCRRSYVVTTIDGRTLQTATRMTVTLSKRNGSWIIDNIRHEAER